MESRRIVSVRSHDDGVDHWEMIDAEPTAILRRRGVRYCSYREHTSSFAARRELATTSGVLIYALDAPLEIVGADGCALTLDTGEAFVGGITDATSLTRALGPQTGVHVFMSLNSLACVIGAPLAEIANRVVPLADFIGKAADDLGSALCETQSAESRFALLDKFLLERFARDVHRDQPVSWAMRKLQHSARPQTTALAYEIGWSRKHFIQRFHEATGFSPDQFRRIHRFERFVAALTAAPHEGLAALAVDTGYVDQAHLARDVRHFAAMTPGELRARLLPSAGGVRD